jgi:hypothetical protein
MKKTFILTQFGTPHEWTQQYIDNVQKLEKYGWYWKIFAPEINNYKFNTKGNVEIIPMTIWGFNKLCVKQLGFDPEVQIENGIPTKPMSDFYVANGVIFQDYLKDTDFWGITNWDVVWGLLDNFIDDDMLAHCDVFSDDVGAVNGVFSLFRNCEEINNLFRKIQDWEGAFKTSAIVGTDEYEMTKLVRDLHFISPSYYPLHSHDRLENHVPIPKLSIKEDGSLWELLADVNPPTWIHARPFIGREIPYFHFSRTKIWPNIV